MPATSTWRRDSKICYLVERRFGDIARFKEAIEVAIARRRGVEPVGPGLLGLAGKGLLSSSFERATVDMICDLIDNLESLPDADLDSVFEGGFGIFGPPADEADLPEEARFNARTFGEPDYPHWARTPFWTLSEALALSLGVEPGYLPDHSIGYLYETDIANRYRRRKELIDRAEIAQELRKVVRPIEFVSWASARDVDLPPDLISEVHHIANRLSGQQVDAPMDQVAHEIAAPAIDDLPKVVAAEFDPRERETLRKLLIAMAVEQYGYKPGAGRSDVPKRVREDAQDLDLEISEQTVRNKLRDAAQILSGAVRKRLASKDN